MTAAEMARNTSRLNSGCHLRRRNGSQKKSSAASIPLPPKVKNRGSGLLRSAAADAAVVVMVSVDVTELVPEIAAG